MKLYIKQKAFSLWDEFYIKDENGNDRYLVNGDMFTLGKKLHVYDAVSDKEVLYLSQKPFSFLPQVEVYVDNNLAYTLIREFTLFVPSFQTDGIDWHIQGDFGAHSYEIAENDKLIATVQKEWFTWGDSYCLEVCNSEDELYALGALLAVDIINAAQAN